MLSNAIYIAGKPQINILPKMLAAINECGTYDETCVSFMVDTNDEKHLDIICKSLNQYGYKTEQFYDYILLGEIEKDAEESK